MGIGKCQVALPCPTRIRDNWGPVPGLVDSWLWTGGTGDPGVAAGISAPCSTLRSSHPGGYIRNRSRAVLLMSPPPKLGMVLRPSCTRMHPQMKRLEWGRGPAMMLNPGSAHREATIPHHRGSVSDGVGRAGTMGLVTQPECRISSSYSSYSTAQHSTVQNDKTTANCSTTHTTTQHSIAQRSTAHNTTAHSTAQHSTAQHATQHHTAHHSIAHHTTPHNTASTAQHNTVQHATQQHTANHSTAQHSTAQHNTTQNRTTTHSAVQHSTAQHNTAQHSTRRNTTPHQHRTNTAPTQHSAA